MSKLRKFYSWIWLCSGALSLGLATTTWTSGFIPLILFGAWGCGIGGFGIGWYASHNKDYTKEVKGDGN